MPKRNRNNMPANFEPPVPAWVADWGSEARSLTTAIFAVQGNEKSVFEAWAESSLSGIDYAPELVNRAQFKDIEGIDNTVLIAYWRDDKHDLWWSNSDVSNWWADSQRLKEGVGYWRERFNIPIERLETLHSTPNSHGIASLAEKLEGPVDEHAYPGAARDRIEITGSKDVTGSTQITKLYSVIEDSGKRVCVTPPKNMCVIRSGQDWSYCEQQERDFYLKEVHPSLIEGMNYLSANPQESRCMSMRFMENIDQDSNVQQQTFGLGYGLDIFAFENWAKSHPTHIKIFDDFMIHATRFGKDMQLRLWHEVSILADQAGEFEYINCHAKTGLLPYCL